MYVFIYFYRACNRVQFSSVFHIYSRRIRLKVGISLKTIFCSLISIMLRGMLGARLPAPAAPVWGSPCPVAGAPARAVGCVCHFPSCRFNQSQSCTRNPETQAQGTLTPLVTQTDTDKLLPSAAPRYRTHIKHKHR